MRGMARHLNQERIVLGLAVLMFVTFAATLPAFLTGANVLNLVRSVSVLGILGIGMAIVRDRARDRLVGGGEHGDLGRVGRCRWRGGACRWAGRCWRGSASSWRPG